MTNLRYLVASRKTDNGIVMIRGFVPADHPNTQGLSKAEAWERAQAFAKPVKLVRSAARGARNLPALAIHFHDDTTGMTLVVQTAQATQERADGNKSVPAIDNTQVSVDNPPMHTKPASDKQIDFILSLMGERLTDDQRTPVIPMVAKLDSAAASKWITRLLELPKLITVPRTNNDVDVPAGHYAIDGADGTTKFYKVDRPTEGKWAGYTFVKVQASDDYHPVKGGAKHTVLAAIAQDPKAASIRYGQELGKCGVCNRTLTDADSIAAGIGPICAEKF